MLKLSQSDALFPIQAEIWRHLGLEINTSKQALQEADMGTCLAAARAVCLSSAELQQLLCPEDIQQRPLNPRNEAAALALLLANTQSVCGDETERQQQLQELLAAYPSNSSSSCNISSHQADASHSPQQEHQQQEHQQPSPFPEGSPESNLYRWAIEQGAVSQVTPAVFGGSCSADNTSNSTSNTTSGDDGGAGGNPEAAVAVTAAGGGLRGCAAACDIAAGSVVMNVPQKLLITYETAAKSDFGKALSRIPGLDPETLAVIWTMVDRHEPDSPHAPFWAALPSHFDTGLSAPQGLIDVLKGSSSSTGSSSSSQLELYEQAVQARAHVRQQFQALQQTFEVLLTAYAAYLQPSWFSEEAYLWAVELWYAYAIQVKFPDGSIQPTLVPLASLVNHNPLAPHIVHFSTVNPETACLELKCFRPVSQQEQVFLSYGPLPNSQLALFYGFAVPGNPFEQQAVKVQPEKVVQLLLGKQLQQKADLQGSQQEQQQQEQETQPRGQLLPDKLQLLQELQLPLDFQLTVQQPLPPGLLYSLRLLCADHAELLQLQEKLKKVQQKKKKQADGTQGDAHTAAASAVAGAATSRGGSRGGSSSGGSSSKKGKSKGSKSSSNAAGAGRNASSSSTTVLEDTQRRWAAASLQAAVLSSSPISSSNEAAAQAVLRELVAAARAPYDASLAKLHKRLQLEAVLQQQQAQPQAKQTAAGGGGGFGAVLEVYLRDVLGLFDACLAAGGGGGG